MGVLSHCCCLLFVIAGLAAEVLESIREKERKMEAVHSEEVQLGAICGKCSLVE